MTSLQRLVLPSAIPGLSPEGLWRVLGLCLAAAAFVLVRACGYDVSAVASYVAYLACFVVLPGIVTLRWVHRAPLSISVVLALAVPTGFALEIFSFLGLAALGAKGLYFWTPLGWVALALWMRRSGRVGFLRLKLAGNHAGVAALLVVACLATTAMAVGQMYAESPLAEGLPTRAIFHDWVYLISRAAVIKHNWPLDDPSLAGTPLQYHYFMMVHAAATSWTTGVEITTVLLRLIYAPIGAVVVAQAYLLGRAVARTPWGGVAAVFLFVAASEISFAPSYGEPMFLGLFVRWLFVSPTFFFGMVYCGALLLAVRHCLRRKDRDVRDYLWLILLGMAGTGAKGTLVPVMVCALGLWAAWRACRERRVPWRLLGIAACLAAAFVLIYVPTMSSWKTGSARWHPFHVFELTAFWRQHLASWTEAFGRVLPAPVASLLAQLACAIIVFGGTCGVRLLAVPYLAWGDLEKRDAQLVGWLGAFFAASAGMGLLMELNSHGELYLVLMMRLPMAVLAAGFLVAASRRVYAWWRLPEDTRNSMSPFARRPPVTADLTVRLFPWLPRVVVGGGVVVLLGAIGVQGSLWWTRNQPGLTEWFNASPNPRPDRSMGELQDALLWIREHTEPNAVLVANAFTPENMRKDHWGALDRTLMGVHFYYSALSERRLWFEGPNYVLNGPLLSRRAALASDFFYRGCRLAPETVAGAPSYVIVDRSLQDDAVVPLPLGSRLFTNSRMVVYRLSEASPPVATAGRVPGTSD